MAVALSQSGSHKRVATIKESLHGQWPWPSAGQVSIREQPLPLYTGVFTWTAAVAISWPGQQNRAAMATLKETLHGQWPWPSSVQISKIEQQWPPLKDTLHVQWPCPLASQLLIAPVKLSRGSSTFCITTCPDSILDCRVHSVNVVHRPTHSQQHSHPPPPPVIHLYIQYI